MDCFHNENIRQTLNVTPVNANTVSYRKQWGEHLLRRDGTRIPEIDLKYNP
jgi:hypothetical protein